jgi:DNA-directed RNA polymerase subunit RPC12/RpoP
MTTTFPCPACGAPVEPLPGESRMPCSYCGTQVTIPKNLRTAKPIRAERIDPSRPDPRIEPPPYHMPDMDMRHILGTSLPIAATALNFGGYWNRIKRWGWSCAALIMIACMLGCVSIVFAFTFIRGN